VSSLAVRPAPQLVLPSPELIVPLALELVPELVPELLPEPCVVIPLRCVILPLDRVCEIRNCLQILALVEYRGVLTRSTCMTNIRRINALLKT
jgi:hypothetical protein